MGALLLVMRKQMWVFFLSYTHLIIIDPQPCKHMFSQIIAAEPLVERHVLALSLMCAPELTYN